MRQVRYNKGNFSAWRHFWPRHHSITLSRRPDGRHDMLARHGVLELRPPSLHDHVPGGHSKHGEALYVHHVMYRIHRVICGENGQTGSQVCSMSGRTHHAQDQNGQVTPANGLTATKNEETLFPANVLFQYTSQRNVITKCCWQRLMGMFPVRVESRLQFHVLRCRMLVDRRSIPTRNMFDSGADNSRVSALTRFIRECHSKVRSHRVIRMMNDGLKDEPDEKEPIRQTDFDCSFVQKHPTLSDELQCQRWTNS